MDHRQKNNGLVWVWLVIVLALGVAARFLVSLWGHNNDFVSYRIVADIMAQGNNVYDNTTRYNYGPIWFNVVHLLDWLAGHDASVFRWLLIGLLTATDIGIFYILWHKFGRLAATLFFLNPVSILITGFHNQFDNLAILIALCALLLFGEDFEKPLNRRKYYGLLVLGLSLMTKHLFFLFPLWLAVKQRGLMQKCVILALPPLIFLAGFIPYWSVGHEGIIQNVFEYRSSPGFINCFYDFFLPGLLKSMASPTLWWLFCLGIFAFICQRKGGLESLLLYTAVLVATSPAMANQYLVIPIAFVAVELNVLSIGYVLFATIHILSFEHGPHLLPVRASYDDLAGTFLIFTVIWVLWRQAILAALQNCRQEINRQFEQGQ